MALVTYWSSPTSADQIIASSGTSIASWSGTSSMTMTNAVWIDEVSDLHLTADTSNNNPVDELELAIQKAAELMRG